MLLSRSPLTLTRRCEPVRLACFRHAASVYPEPGSNSPSELSEVHLPYSKELKTMAFSDDLSESSRSPPLFDCQRASRAPTSPPARRVPFWPGEAPSRPTCHYSSPERRRSREALAPADCPTQLPTQYRWRWGVSRPCSGRERVGPPRLRHQGHRLTGVSEE